MAHAEEVGNPVGDVVADLVELLENLGLDIIGLEVGCLEADGIDQELLLNGGERVVEQARLRAVVGEGLRPLACQAAVDCTVWCGEESLAFGLVGLRWVSFVQGVGRVWACQ